jgi:hypothetical protein
LEVYPVPVITASTLKVVKPVALEDTESVTIADITWFTAKVAPSLFQVTLTGPLAAAGFQFTTDRLNVTGEAPTFLT